MNTAVEIFILNAFILPQLSQKQKPLTHHWITLCLHHELRYVQEFSQMCLYDFSLYTL